ncbi:hypothetical protein [Tellurirhabdus rosea]|uniref:hypothetical protein n=1 Tax=Tellurirhabdus rosea TaxID=2674997 RepID=UPI002259DCCF|nr:hypothetical protein [Tellurirhabdus rosea]
MVVRQLIGNAKPILDSLTQLHFLRGQHSALQLQLAESRSNLSAAHGRLAASLGQQEQYGHQVVQLTYQVGQLRRRLGRARLEVWLWRTGAAVGIYLKVRPMFR